MLGIGHNTRAHSQSANQPNQCSRVGCLPEPPVRSEPVARAEYKYLGMWVFDDARAGLVQEPFVEGADVIIDQAVEGISSARDGFLMTVLGDAVSGLSVPAIVVTSSDC